MLKIHLSIPHFKIRFFSTTYSLANIIKIGNVVKNVERPQNPELVPIKYLSEKNNKSEVKHLQWMLQKDILGQDIFLIGPPGSYRRKLAMSFAELTKREIEYVSLSRDTTESDLKQRREIVHGNAIYIDQAAMRAATNGRILILDGIEKTEQNVLPILNNLLENREMQLEDGRFLMRASFYDNLLEKYSQQELDRWRFVRCNDKFRVIALGLPVPQFKGNPLDPPLRSRFQSRFVEPAGGSYEELIEMMKTKFPTIPLDQITRIMSFIFTVSNSEKSEEIPFFPMDNIISTLGLLSAFPKISDLELIQRMYPFQILTNEIGMKIIDELINKFNVKSSKVNNNINNIKDNINSNQLKNNQQSQNMVMTSTIDELIDKISMTHSVGDFCIIGPQGCGKSTIVSALANKFHAQLSHVILYSDMTAREILQQRETDLDSGDTVWRNSALVRASMEGSWAVLEGLDRLEKGCMAVLNQLITDRQLQLFDGSRLIRSDRYDSIKMMERWSDEDMRNRGIYRIHENFRIIGLANPPAIPGESSDSISSNRLDWLSPEVLTSFRFHVLPELSRDDEQKIVLKLIPNTSKVQLNLLLDVVHKLRKSDNAQIRNLSQNLSVRQILRIINRITLYPSETISNSIHNACLSKFLPSLVKDSLAQILQEFDDIDKPESSVNQLSDEQQLEQLIVKYKTTVHPNGGSVMGEDEAKVPNILFYDSVAHTRLLLEMLQDFMMGNSYYDRPHLLLIGNQGVGKNKIVDRLLQLLNRPREYIQLHRDTTVQNLTLQPSIIDGKLFYEDSALVKAISKGRILVIDEADKASTQVTCILKTLVSLGEMELSDGRRIVPENYDTSHLLEKQVDKLIRIHKDFRMIVLANRPGFPFLGNDFFGAMGDVFSCHAVDNPDMVSEIKMLQKYGPQVPEDIIKKLVYLFSDLRTLSDGGQINYPYSTRELVNIVKHLEEYPKDAISTVIGNVFDFDISSKEMLPTLQTVLEKHGISLPGSLVRVVLAKELPLPSSINSEKWSVNFKSPKNIPVTFHSSTNESYPPLNVTKTKIETQITRSKIFSELDECISIQLGEYNIVSDMISSDFENYSKAYLHVVTLNPIVLTTLTLSKDNKGNCNKLSVANCNQIDLSYIFPPVQGSFRPLIYLASLPSPNETDVLLFETTTNRLVHVDTKSGELFCTKCQKCLPENKINVRPTWLSVRDELRNQKYMRMHRNWSTHSTEPVIAFHKPGDDFIAVFHVSQDRWHSLSTGFPISALHMICKDQWLIQDLNKKLYVINEDNFSNPKYTLYEIDRKDKSLVNDIIFSDKVDVSNLFQDLTQNIHSDEVILGKSKDSFVDIFPPSLMTKESFSLVKIPRPSAIPTLSNHFSSSVLLPTPGMVVTMLDKEDVPEKCQETGYSNFTSINGYLEVVDLKSHTVKYLPVPSVFAEPQIFQWLKINIPNLFVARLNNNLITIDNTGCIHRWTVCQSELQSELKVWKMSAGVEFDNDRDVMIERLDKDVDTSLGSPKHGKIDITRAPHVGGNTWAGGTGGRDTAGLGGVGGPYRLDAGHNVFQVSDNIKASVPDHIKAAAREVAQKAWKERLEAIKMSALDHDLYMQYYRKVESHIVAIKAILDSLQATAKERQWIRHRTHGDLDDGKLVEGVLGEKSIYRARGEKNPEPGSPQTKPKMLRIICDLSGSMYRFNGHDQRLQRQLEAILMLMESFVNVKAHKLVYEIYGHSGEGPQFPFVTLQNLPANEKQRMDILSEMIAHSQFCLSGDHTLEAIDTGIKELKKNSESYDQSFLVILSDANLSRYGIPASSISKLLLKDKSINAFIVFIGTLGNQAQILRKNLPAGHAFVCLDIEMLPKILRHIFTTNIL